MEKELVFLPYKMLQKGGSGEITEKKIPLYRHAGSCGVGGRGCGVYRIGEEEILGCEA